MDLRRIGEFTYIHPYDITGGVQDEQVPTPAHTVHIVARKSHFESFFLELEALLNETLYPRIPNLEHRFYEKIERFAYTKGCHVACVLRTHENPEVFEGDVLFFHHLPRS